MRQIPEFLIGTPVQGLVLTARAWSVVVLLSFPRQSVSEVAEGTHSGRKHWPFGSPPG